MRYIFDWIFGSIKTWQIVNYFPKNQIVLEELI